MLDPCSTRRDYSNRSGDWKWENEKEFGLTVLALAKVARGGLWMGVKSFRQGEHFQIRRHCTQGGTPTVLYHS